jgi:hypothetical protein
VLQHHLLDLHRALQQLQQTDLDPGPLRGRTDLCALSDRLARVGGARVLVPRVRGGRRQRSLR